MAHIIELPSISDWIKVFWMYVIKPLWWLWLLALGIGLLPIGLNYLFGQLKKNMFKK